LGKEKKTSSSSSFKKLDNRKKGKKYNEIFCDYIQEILRDGEHTTGQIREKIRTLDPDLYKKIESEYIQGEIGSDNRKLVDGALQTLKRKQVVEKPRGYRTIWKLASYNSKTLK
jgi:hypothetical protein